MKAVKGIGFLFVLIFVVLVELIVYDSRGSTYVNIYRFYVNIWFVFFGIKTFVIFFFLGGLIRISQKSIKILGVAFFISYLLTRSLPLNAIFAICGYLIGYLIKFREERYFTAVKIGLMTIVADILWPSNLITYPVMAVSRPTILNFIVGLFSDPSFKFGTSRSIMQNNIMIEKQVGYLFGILPITVGEPNGLSMLRPELQIVYSLAAFFFIYWFMKTIISWTSENKGKGIMSSFIVYGLIFLPVFGLTNILLVTLGTAIGLRAYQADFIPSFFRSLSAIKINLFIVVCLALYQLCFRTAIEDGFGMVGDVYEEFLYSGAAILSIILGMIIGRAKEFAASTD